MASYIVSPGASLRGQVRVAGDKSISHRAVMFGALANGVTRVSQLLEGEDVMATIAAFRAMGVPISGQRGDYIIEGVGLHGLKQPDRVLDMGNSGTACRLLAGILSGQPWTATMSGDNSLNSRPMARIIDPLTRMGASIRSNNGCPPLDIGAGQGRSTSLRGISYEMPIASAQVKSAILLAGLYATGTTRVREPKPTRDHTERMLAGFGYPVRRRDGWVELTGGGALTATDVVVPSDLSSAAFFLLAGLISVDTELTLPGVGINPSRNGALSILRRMGGNISLVNEREVGGEPVADIRVSSSELRGVEIDGMDVALAVDEIPSIAVAAACAEGVTRIRGAEELRVKESDRISTTVEGLRRLGISVEEHADGMTITGGDICGGVVDSHDDHRIAMAFAVAGNAATGPVRVKNIECVATSFPGFDGLSRHIGLSVQVESEGAD